MATLEIWDWDGKVFHSQQVSSIRQAREIWENVAGKASLDDEPAPCEFSVRNGERVFYWGNFITDEC